MTRKAFQILTHLIVERIANTRRELLAHQRSEFIASPFDKFPGTTKNIFLARKDAGIERLTADLAALEQVQAELLTIEVKD